MLYCRSEAWLSLQDHSSALCLELRHLVKPTQLIQCIADWLNHMLLVKRCFREPLILQDDLIELFQPVLLVVPDLLDLL